MAKVAVRRSVAPAPSLLANLVAYWPLSEASGQRNDLHTNALHLSEVGTLGSAAGLVYANAAVFDMDVDAGLYRARAASAPINFNSSTPFTMVAWLYLTSESGGPDSPNYYRTIMTFNAGSSFGGGYHMQTTADRQIYVVLGKTGGPPQYTSHVPSNNLTLNQWSMFAWTHDAGALTYYLDGNIVNSEANGYPFTAATSGDFYIGIRGGTSQVWDGRIGPVLMFDKALSESELDWLYNGGAGRTYATLE